VTYLTSKQSSISLLEQVFIGSYKPAEEQSTTAGKEHDQLLDCIISIIEIFTMVASFGEISDHFKFTLVEKGTLEMCFEFLGTVKLITD